MVISAVPQVARRGKYQMVHMSRHSTTVYWSQFRPDTPRSKAHVFLRLAAQGAGLYLTAQDSFSDNDHMCTYMYVYTFTCTCTCTCSWLLSEREDGRGSEVIVREAMISPRVPSLTPHIPAAQGCANILHSPIATVCIVHGGYTHTHLLSLYSTGPEQQTYHIYLYMYILPPSSLTHSLSVSPTLTREPFEHTRQSSLQHDVRTKSNALCSRRFCPHTHHSTFLQRNSIYYIEPTPFHSHHYTNTYQVLRMYTCRSNIQSTCVYTVNVFLRLL